MQIETVNATPTGNGGKPTTTAWNGNTGPSPGNLPAGATMLAATSGKVANAVAAASLSAAASVTTYIRKLLVSVGGATAEGTADLTITGLLGGTVVIPVYVPANANQVNTFSIDFDVGGWPASAVNTAIAASLAALGAGNVSASVSVMGYRI